MSGRHRGDADDIRRSAVRENVRLRKENARLREILAGWSRGSSWAPADPRGEGLRFVSGPGGTSDLAYPVPGD